MAIASGRSGGESRRRRDEVFPRLEVFIWAGVLLGLIAGIALAGLERRPDGTLLNRVGQGIGLGGILGLFVGLGRGVWRAGPTVRAPGPPPAAELWDPWLDHGRDPDPAGPEVGIEEPATPQEAPAPIVPRAAVRPRVISPRTGEAIPLEDEIGPMIQEGRGGLVVIVGGPGSGKATAMRHLDAILPPWARGRVRLVEDEIDLAAAAHAGPDPLVIFATDPRRVQGIPPAQALFVAIHGWPADRFFSYRLARWTPDDAIEYLLATDRDACASVMSRLTASGDFSILDGIPELCTAVLDGMARYESIGGARTGLRLELATRAARTRVHPERLGESCLKPFRRDDDAQSPGAVLEVFPTDGTGESLARLIRHRPAALLLAAEMVVALIRGAGPTRDLEGRYDRDLVREVARMIAGDTEAIANLNGWINGKLRGVHPLAASLLHAATPGWRPFPERPPCLEGAYLDGVAWPGQDLAGADLRRADLSGADLREANLERADAKGACLHGADLRGAMLRCWVATGADLSRADLSSVQARGVRLREADLSGAVLIDAGLWQADLTGARIEESDFTGASLDDARLEGLPLCRARFEGARFGGAILRRCDLEGMTLTGPDFHDARLNHALLTGSRMPDASFRGADLRGARLAEVDWPGADLRDADLRGASFHLGTARSGLVGSPIACEGSRTGFYTHDDLDRDVRPAAEIRKANLRGADLRGADIRDVDFYLVDLRGARYTDNQASHLRRCRAILDDRSG